MTVVEVSPATLLAEPHHDGSEEYVVPGDVTTVRLRVPSGGAVDAVALRYVQDGEPRIVPATVDAEGWWRAEFPVTAPAMRYRWLLSGGGAGYAWLNGLGAVPHEVSDADDFVLSVDAGGPDWHLSSAVYQIFPDRFAREGVDAEPPDWAVPRQWHALPEGRGRNTPFEWFGGDLPGIERRLDHVAELGASVLYMTPIFPAGSTHRYDATSFDRVDPLLGGDEALASLVAAVHARGMRIVGDLTPNHSGIGHEWFVCGERELYYFDDSLPLGYEAWLGVPSLPKLNWESPELRKRMLAIARRWLDFGLDGWRIDVANMTGRLGPVDLNDQVARLVRGVVEPDELLVAEHFHDFRPDLQGAGWHGVMNYAGFLRPVWSWLGTKDDVVFDLAGTFPRVAGAHAVAAMRTFRCGVPWPSILHSWALLDSHDTARFRTVAGSRALQAVGIGLQMTSPGVPMVFAGDELGLEGKWGEDARRTIPWDRPETWDTALLETYKRLIALRRSSDALARGGIRYAFVDDDVIVYLRETAGERLLCLASRAEHAPVGLPLALLGCRELEPVTGADAVCETEWAFLPADGPEFHIWRLV